MFRRNLRVLRCFPLLSYSNRMKFHSSTFRILYSRFDKDLPNPNLPTPASKLYGPETDILLQELKKSKTLSRTLELTEMHLNVMNSKHVVTCLESIHDCLNGDFEAAKELQVNQIFQDLCSRMMKVIRLFEPSEVITTYKVLSALQIRNNTYIMQCVLKMLGAHLNNMSLGQLIFINYLLKKQRHNSLVDGLVLAIPLVVQVQIDQQLDSDNMAEVAGCLQLACRSRLKPTIIEKIVGVIIKKSFTLTAETALTVAFSLLNLDAPIDGYRELLNTSFDILSKNIMQLSSSKLLAIIRTCQSQRYYHHKFFYAVTKHIISEKWNLDSMYSVVNYFNRLEFCPSSILDYFAEILCTESVQYQNSEFYSPLNGIECLTVSSYRPSHIDEAARVLYSDEIKLNNLLKRSPNLLLKFFTCLAMLGHFPKDWLAKILNEDFLYSAMSSSRKQGRGLEFERNIISLLWGLQLYDETKNFCIPSIVLNKCFDGVFQRHMNEEFPLEKFIENGLGGSQFLQNGVFTQDGHFIDHVVAMRSGNYPVSIQRIKEKKEKYLNSQIFVDDIILPEDAKIIAIIVAKEAFYCREPEILRGWADLKIRNLNKKNYSPLVINYAVWENLPDREKIPFLMREIKQAVQDDCALKTTFY